MSNLIEIKLIALCNHNTDDVLKAESEKPTLMINKIYSQNNVSQHYLAIKYSLNIKAKRILFFIQSHRSEKQKIVHHSLIAFVPYKLNDIR